MREDLFDIFYVSTEIYLLLIAFMILIYGVFAKSVTCKNITIPAIFALSFSFLFQYDFVPSDENFLFNGLFYSSNITSIAKSLTIAATIVIFILLSSLKHGRESNMNKFELPAILFFAMIGMMLMISANDFLSLYLSMEMMSLSLYVLAAFDRDDISSAESGIKYFILGALASGLILFGVSLIYGFAGTVNFTNLAEIFKQDFHIGSSVIAVQIGLVLVLSGFLFKLSAAPYHFWTPDVYEGAPTIVTAFFATVTKISLVFIVYRMLSYAFAGYYASWSQILIFVSGLSMIVGAVGGLAQKNLKRLLAYSSINHVGFLILAIAMNTNHSLHAVIIYLVIYLVMNLGLFAILLSMRSNNKNTTEIVALSGLGRQKPWFAAIVGILMFSMAGIPPFAGFFSKFYILKLSIENNHVYLACVAVLSSVIAAFYYLRIVKVMYFDEVNSHTIDGHAPFQQSFVYNMAAIFNLMLFVFFDVLLSYVSSITS
jgi:NADH-quinone oxidoreductase subunit N